VYWAGLPYFNPHSFRNTLDQLAYELKLHGEQPKACSQKREQALDQLFARREITPDRLAIETAVIGELSARLRSVHLAAHLETRALFHPDQIALYERLRGYRPGIRASSEMAAVCRVAAQPSASTSGARKMPPPTPVTPDTSPMIPPTSNDPRKGGVSAAARSSGLVARAERAICIPATSSNAPTTGW
jgi:hypothetical protein